MRISDWSSDVCSSDLSGAVLSSAAFEAALPGVGHYVIAVALAIFAFTTILGWSYLSERCWEFLVGVRAILPFRIIRSEEHTSELQSLMRISYAVFCLKKKKKQYYQTQNNTVLQHTLQEMQE